MHMHTYIYIHYIFYFMYLAVYMCAHLYPLGVVSIFEDLNRSMVWIVTSFTPWPSHGTGRHMILWTFLAPQQWVGGPGAGALVTRIHFRWPGSVLVKMFSLKWLVLKKATCFLDVELFTIRSQDLWDLCHAQQLWSPRTYLPALGHHPLTQILKMKQTPETMLDV